MTLNKPKKISTGTTFETEMLLLRNLRYVTILGLSEKTPPNALVSKEGFVWFTSNGILRF